MNPTIQPGMHPDAERLTAFAEQSLPAAERDQVLLHMAECSRCREVVFLSQQAVENEQPYPVSAMDDPAARRRISWFEGWRWAWIPVAAMATFVGVAVMQHFRHPAENTEMAVNHGATDALRKAAPPPNPAESEAAPQPDAKQSSAGQSPAPKIATNSAALEELKSTEPGAKRDRYPEREDKEETKQLDEKKSVNAKDRAIAQPAISAQPPAVAGGSINDIARKELTARSKGTSTGGPAALNQLQQQNLAQQNLSPQYSALKTQNTPADTNKMPAQARAALGAASETVEVHTGRLDALSKPVPAAPPQVSAPPLAGAYHGDLSEVVAKQKSLQKVILPGGLGILASASDAERTIALDTSGALFLSEDGGKKWQAIHTQWTGRALLVRTRATTTQKGVVLALPAPRFELVNDKFQTWSSYDGKTWTEQPLPLK